VAIPINEPASAPSTVYVILPALLQVKVMRPALAGCAIIKARANTGISFTRLAGSFMKRFSWEQENCRRRALWETPVTEAERR
jgi:hypothetical protein